jgi:hypothetical protein
MVGRESRPRWRALLAGTLALLCAGCSKLEVEWTPGAGEVSFVAHGPKDAELLVIAGPPDGPHVMPGGDLSLWTTVGAAKAGSTGVVVAQVPFDEHGVARGVLRDGSGVPGAIVVQAVAVARTGYKSPLAVSSCVAVSREDGRLRIRPHAVEVLSSPAGWTLGGALAAVALGIVLRRVRVPWGKLRPVTTVLVLLAAGFLFSLRILASANAVGAGSSAPPLPLVRRGRPTFAEADPLDRVTRSGMRALLDGVRAAAPAGDVVRIVPAAWEASAWALPLQAAWLLWPIRTEFVERGTERARRRGVFLTFDAVLKRPGARVLFENAVGSLWSAEDEPR